LKLSYLEDKIQESGIIEKGIELFEKHLAETEK